MSLILTLNAGSSSIKFSVYDAALDRDGDGEPDELLGGRVESLGPAARLVTEGASGPGPTGGPAVERSEETIGAADHGVAIAAILARLEAILGERAIAGVGHRVVQGGLDFDRPALLDDLAIAKLAALEPLAPLHQPHNLAAVRAARDAFPGVPQVAAFDTSFHRGQPFVEDTFGLPLRFFEEGVRRYGFHGLSYDYVTGLIATRHPDLAGLRTIVAHLGNGASMCAVREGRSLASTMGFSALDGLCMGTRCGQIDPGVLLYLMEGGDGGRAMSAAEITTLLYRESGLKGLSGIGNDMRELERAAGEGHRDAARAIDYFVHRIRREIGSLAAAMGGLDALIFTGGIGENSATIRARVCEGMEWIGIALDEAANRAGIAGDEVAIGRGPVRVMALRTDEERVIARAVSRVLSGHDRGGTGGVAAGHGFETVHAQG